MKRWMVTASILLMSGSIALAESASYEAQFGLITVSGFIVFYSTQGPLSYHTMTLKDLPDDATLSGEVTGKSCQHGISIPIFMDITRSITLSGAKGDGGFKKAIVSIHRDHPRLDGLFDIKVDTHQLSILGIYKRQCTEVSARGFSLQKPINSLK